MRKLKNWFVAFETIKGGAVGLINSVDYIFDNEHNNHIKDGHSIVAYDGGNSERNLKNILRIQQNKDIEVKLAKKGGRTASYGKNLLVSFPTEIKLTNEEYKQIRNHLLYELIKFISSENDLNYTKQQIIHTIQNLTLSSLHKQNNNDHLNFVIGNVFIDYTREKSLKRIDLGKKKYSHFLKATTNKLLLKYGHNFLDYQIKKQRQQRNRKNKLSHTIDKLNDTIEQSVKEIEHLQSLFQELTFLKDTSEKLEKRINTYINRMKTAIEEKNVEKYTKNLDLVNKSYEKLAGLVDDEQKKKLSKFEELKKAVEAKKFNQTLVSNYPVPKRK